MAKIKQRRMFWDAPAATDVVDYKVYAEKVSAMDNATFLAMADTFEEQGGLVPHDVTEDTHYYLVNLEEDIYQLAVVARDDGGNDSDPYQHPAWVSVPLDVSPPDAPTGGGLD